MKRAFFTFLGAVAFLLASYALVRLFASWYGPRFIESDSDINDAYMGSLIFMLISVVVGAIVGFKLSGRRARARPIEHRDSQRKRV